MKEYIFSLNGKFTLIPATNLSEAYMYLRKLYKNSEEWKWKGVQPLNGAT